ncbi:hypothetical protein FRC12_014815 [Ceratobasidium sp. 428]|nr:hypothetical protein FRC12_014815 [Ceratobasidium sp. 428]
MVQPYGPLDAEADVVPYLLEVSKALDAGTIALADAIAELDTVLASQVLDTQTQEYKDHMRDSYVRQYQTRDAARDAAQQAGQPQNGAPAGPGAPPGAGGGPIPPGPAQPGAAAQPANAPPAPNGNPGVQQPAADDLAGLHLDEFREFLQWKRSREPEADGPSAKKSKTVYPWSGLPTVDQDPDLHPNVRETRRRVLQFADDLDGAKKDLLGVSHLPEVPDSVWRTILKNEYVDLDKIHSAYTSTTDTKRKAEKIAEGVYLQTEGDAPTKHITQSTEWLPVFRVYMRAVTTAFPHRVKEFEAWETHLSRKFKIYQPTSHRGIIAAEFAARRSVFDSSSRTLFEVQLLDELLPAWVAVNGVEYGSVPKTTGTGGESSSGSRQPRRPRKSPKETPCRNWNDGRCYHPSCRYGHICSICRGDHAKSACKKTSN